MQNPEVDPPTLEKINNSPNVHSVETNTSHEIGEKGFPPCGNAKALIPIKVDLSFSNRSIWSVGLNGTDYFDASKV
jgi:hypothetical protein